MHVNSLKHHITHLEDVHVKLEKELLILEKLHSNDIQVQTVKKKKLYIKDELIRCRNTLNEMLK